MNTIRTQPTGSLLNFSNHPSCRWPPEQSAAALALGDTITDIPFPQVSVDASEEEINRIAQDCASTILAACPATVMCMGEYGVCYRVIRILKAHHIRVVYTCTERRTQEQVTPPGHTEALRIPVRQIPHLLNFLVSAKKSRPPCDNTMKGVEAMRTRPVFR